MNTPKLSVVFSTRKINENYIKHIKKTSGVDNIEIIPFENNGEYSLTQIYNKGLETSSANIVVFCHDDLIFETLYWGNKLLRHFKNNPHYGIIGIAGTNHLVNGMWWTLRESMHGIVNHSDGNKKWTNRYSKDQGYEIKPMAIVDGLFFGVDKNKIKTKFDENFVGFHFYDLSFCISNLLEGVNVGVVTNILVTHLSVGQTNQQWEENRKLFEEKYRDVFEIKVS